jgi:hypothetical protein
MSQLKVTKYVNVPRIGVRSGIALGVALGSAVPDAAPDAVRTAATKVGSKVTSLQAGWAAQQSASPADARPADARSDKAWRATHDTLNGLRKLGTTSRGQAAQRFFELLFPDGMTFTRLPFREQWVECEQRLEKLRDDAVADEFNDVLGGPECLDELQAAHDAYGRALDITESAEAEAEPGVATALRELKDAISDYTVQVLAWSRTSAESEQLARKALLPIDELRAATKRSKSNAPDSTAVAPVGTVTAVGTVTPTT